MNAGSQRSPLQQTPLSLGHWRAERRDAGVLQEPLSHTEFPLAKEAVRLLARELSERAGVEVVQGEASAGIILSVDPGPVAEGYRIDKVGDAVRIEEAR